jgi:hypothetical protein
MHILAYGQENASTHRTVGKFSIVEHPEIVCTILNNGEGVPSARELD